MTFYENMNTNLLRRLLTGILYVSIESADTGQLDASNQPVNNPASGLDPGRIWVRVGDPQRSAVVAWNARINAQITNIPVLVGINRFTRSLEVIDLDIPRAAARFGDAISSLYAQPSGDLTTTTTRGRNFKPGRVFVNGGTLVAKAAPFFYKDSADAIKYWDATGTVTITPPAASGGTDTIRWTIIALNPDATTPALVAINGTAQLVTLPAPPSPDDLAAIAITDGYYPLAAAKVTTGDTTILEANWVDFRLYFDKDGAISGMTSFTAAADSGSSQTISNGNTLTFVGGTGIDTVASATDTITINIDSTVVTLTGSQILTNKTLTAPTIADFTNANHDHLDADDGGTLTAAAISNFNESVDDRVDALILAGNNIAKVYDDSGGSLTLYAGKLVKNTSGATVAAGDVGIIIYDASNGYVYNRTTTANYPDVGNIAVVLVGGANNADIYVTNRGRVTLNYTGTAPSAGQWVTTSTTGGSAQRTTTMRPEIFGVAEVTGSGGTVQVQLLTQTTFVPLTSSNDVHRVVSASDSDFRATINGAPSATSVVYNAPSSGAENVINVASSSELAKMRLFNETRSTYRYISSVNTGTNTITTISSTDAWASTDTITIRSQTNTATIVSGRFYDLDFSQTSVVPLLARAVLIELQCLDSAAGGERGVVHPFEADDGSKRVFLNTQVANNSAQRSVTVPLADQKFCYLHEASGGGTFDSTLRLSGYWLATP